MEIIGFVGLGTIGGVIAKNIQKAGYSMVVHDVRLAAVKPMVDGGIYEPTRRPERLTSRGLDGCLDPDAIARTYLQLHRQHRSSWASHIELRPWSEKF